MRAVRMPRPALASIVLLCLAAVTSATVTGELKLSSVNAVMTVTLTSITFNTNTASNPPGPPWNGGIANTTSLTFAGCPSGVLGALGCLDSGVFTPAEAVEIAQNVTISAGAGLGPNNPFIVFAGNGVAHASISYMATFLGPGSSNTACQNVVNIGDSCSIFAGSPFVLTLTATGTNVSLAAGGTVTDGAVVSNWIGQFSEPITNMTPAQVQSFFCTGPVVSGAATCTAADFASGRSIAKPWSGDFVASTNPVSCTNGVCSGCGLTIACPANITTSTTSGQFGAFVNPGTPSTSDNCSGASVSVSGARSDGQPLNALYPIGVTLITWTAMDTLGHTASCTQTITVMVPTETHRHRRILP